MTSVKKGAQLWRAKHPTDTIEADDLTPAALSSPAARGRAAWHARHGNTDASKALRTWKLEQVNDGDNVRTGDAA
jgi:hypothetical protein